MLFIFLIYACIHKQKHLTVLYFQSVNSWTDCLSQSQGGNEILGPSCHFLFQSLGTLPACNEDYS